MRNVIKLFLLVGCGNGVKKEFDVEGFSKLFESEFSRYEIVEDELMTKPGYYLAKVLFYDEYDRAILNVEYFDNETDQHNRSDYVKRVNEYSIKMLYDSLETVSGG